MSYSFNDPIREIGAETMRAAIFYGKCDVRIEEVAEPQLRPDEALVKICAAGICGSDLHRFRGHEPWGTQAIYPHRGGHEMAGVVAKLGADVHKIPVGQPVAIEPMQLAGCGQCPECLRGDSNICLNRGSGKSNAARRVSAGFSEYDVAARNHLYPLPENLAFEVAALADVYACAVHALHRIPVTDADTVVVIGNGSVAFALGQLARLRGSRTIMVGRRQPLLEQAVRAGAADTVINLLQTDAPAELDRLTEGRGARVVFEAVGGTSSGTIQLAIHAAAPGGEIGILGAFVGSVQVPYREANRKEINLRWCNGYATWNGQREFQIALDLLAQGKVNAAQLITHRFGLEDVARAFQTADNKAQSSAIKVILEPAG